MYQSDVTREASKKRKIKRIIKNTLSTLAIIIIIVLATALIMKMEENRDLKEQVGNLTVMITAERAEVHEPARGSVNRIESLGAFKIYHYCSCSICNTNTNGMTASGTRAREGRTIATDPSVIPTGSTVIIEGNEYVAEDTGSGIIGKKIDVFVGSHEEALKLGVKTVEVFIERR